MFCQLWEGGAGSSPASCHPRVRLPAGDLRFGLAEHAPLVKMAPVRCTGRWESYRAKLIRELIDTVMNLFWVPGCMCLPWRRRERLAGQCFTPG